MPVLMPFGQRIQSLREMYADGVPAARHPETDDLATALARRVRIRLACRQALERHHAEDLMRRSAAARTRPVKYVEIGQRLTFYRQYSMPGAIKKPAARGSLVGPGIVIGLQNKNGLRIRVVVT